MSRTLRLFLSALVPLLVVGGLQAPAQAATTWAYNSASGGTLVKLSSGLVTSDMTSKSGINGSKVPNSHSNSVASVSALGLVKAGAVSTSNTATAVTGGTQVKSTAQTAAVNLLNGLITVDAVKSQITTLLKSDGTSTSTGNTELVNLKIVGVTVPLNISKNTVLSIPGVATVSLNGFYTGITDGIRGSMGWGLAVKLLEPQGNLPAGAVISVNPMIQGAGPIVPFEGAALGGQAYGTRILAKVSDTTQVESPATARLTTPTGSSDGATLKNSTVGVNLPGVLTTGVIESTSTSDRFGTGDKDADVVMTNEVAGVNLLAGLVTVDALKVQAHGRRVNGVCTGDLKMTAVNLKVAGTVIPLDVSPNTVIDVAGIAKVIVNQQTKVGCATQIRGVQVILTTATAGLPVGATAEIGFASTQIN